MKKLFLSAVAVLAFSFASAQEGSFKAGVNLNMPMGDTADLASFGFGVDAAYMWPIADQLQVGASVGYLTFSAKEIDLGEGEKFKPDNASFIPIVATGQYSFSDNFYGGLDLGFAMGMNEGNDGGMMYQPKVGYQTEKFEVFLGYKGIATEGTATTAISLGFNYKF